MKIIAIEHEKEGVTTNDFQPHLEAEAQKVYELYKKGIIREIFFRGDEKSAVIIMECDDKDSASNILNDLPLVKQGLIDFEVIPLVPYPGFDRIMK